MTVLDTFYLLFKTNADEIRKGTEQAGKAADGLEEKLKKANKESNLLGKNFVKVVEGATEAAAAIFSFGAIKSGIVDQAKFNSGLQVQAKLYGLNANEIKQFGYAAEQAGGSVAGFQGSLANAIQAATATGLPVKGVADYFRSVHGFIAGYSQSQKLGFLNQLGISDPGLLSILTANDAEFERSLALVEKNTEKTQGAYEASRNFEKALADQGQSFKHLFDIMDADILPAITSLIAAFTGFTDGLKGSKTEMYEFFGGMATLAVAASGAVGKLAASLLGLAGGAGVLAKLSSRLGIAGFAAAGLPLIADLSYSAGQGIGHFANRLLGRGDANGVLAGPSSPVPKSAMDFWTSQGYTREQAAGIVANEQAESGGNPAARNGSHVGLYQWDRSRQAAILAATGIDVRTADADAQRRAAAWELVHGGYADKIRALNDPNAVAAYVNDRYEVSSDNPYGLAANAARRGQIALGLVRSTPLSGDANPSNSSSISVKIDEVNVQTHATDSAGIANSIGTDLTSSVRSAIAGLDDGRQM